VAVVLSHQTVTHSTVPTESAPRRPSLAGDRPVVLIIRKQAHSQASYVETSPGCFSPRGSDDEVGPPQPEPLRGSSTHRPQPGRLVSCWASSSPLLNLFLLGVAPPTGGAHPYSVGTPYIQRYLGLSLQCRMRFSHGRAKRVGCAGRCLYGLVKGFASLLSILRARRPLRASTRSQPLEVSSMNSLGAASSPERESHIPVADRFVSGSASMTCSSCSRFTGGLSPGESRRDAPYR
jgi:hypothetical protein